MSSETRPPQGFMASVPTRVKLLIFTQVLNTFSFGYFLIYLTAYLVEANEIDAAGVGLLLGLETVVVILAGIPLALQSDKTGRKKFLLLGNFLLPFTIVLFALSHDFNYYILAVCLAGVAEAASLGSWNAIIADQTDLSNRDAAFSLSFIVSNVSLSAGLALPLAMPFVQTTFGLGSDYVHSETLLILGLLNFAAPLMVWFLLRDYREAPRSVVDKEEPGQLGLLLKFSGLNGIIGLGAGLIIPLLGTWLLYKFSVTDTYSGPLLAISSMTIAFAAVGSPRLSKKYGLFKAILMTAGSSTLFMLSLAFVPNVILASLMYLTRASLMNMASPLMDSYLMSIVHPSRRGLGSTLSAIVWRLPNSATTIVGGFILNLGITTGNHFFYDLPWLVASLCYAVGILLIYLTFKNVKPRG